MSWSGETSNELSGTVAGSAVQARSIGGGVHFYAAPPGEPVIRVPRQLPARPAHFTDRSGPIAVITDAAVAAAGGALVIVVVCGGGGTGKTATAVHALYEAAGLFPGGQLYAALGGFSPGGRVVPEVVVARWLRGLGVHPSGLPSDPAEAAALFRSLTAVRPVAVLADDAADAGQVRGLLPGAGLVVVTSRYQMSSLIARDGARLVRLGPLEAPAAAELAGRIIARPGAGPDALGELARWCGNLPLAIRATAARLAVRPHLRIEQVTGELAAVRQSLRAFEISSQEGIVSAVMQASYDALDPDAARAYRLLSLHPGRDFTADAAAALLDASTGQAGHLITVLAGASLLDEASPGRWRFHDLTRAHAGEVAAVCESGDERAAAVARVIDYYLRASAAADLLILPGRLRIAAAFGLPSLDPPVYASTAEALAWCDSEQANLLQAQRAAADLGLHSFAWQFADTLWGWCSHRHDYVAWQSLCETAILSARACGDARADVFAAIRLASCHIARGDIAAAAPVADAAIGTAWASGDRAGEGSAREHAGICAVATGDYAAAIRHCTRGLDCWRRIAGHRRAEAILERLLGRAYAGLGDYQQAATHLDAALAVFTELGERYHTARTKYVMATTLLASSRSAQPAREAIALLQQARPLLEAEDHPLSESELLTALAEAHHRAGNVGQARSCLNEATALQQMLSLPASHPARARASDIASQITATSSGEPGEGTGYLPGSGQARGDRDG